jgi:hypothetical protein
MDLDRHRRFSLTIGLVLATWSFAVELDSTKTIAPLGLPLKVVRPDLIPAALAAAAIYSAARFWFYGVHLLPNTIAKRLAIRRLRSVLSPNSKQQAIHPDEADHEDKLFAASHKLLLLPGPRLPRARQDLKEIYPSVSGKAHLLFATSRYEESKFEEHSPQYHILSIPRAVRVAACVRDLDYLAPIWVPLSATILFLISLWL